MNTRPRPSSGFESAEEWILPPERIKVLPVLILRFALIVSAINCLLWLIAFILQVIYLIIKSTITKWITIVSFLGGITRRSGFEIWSRLHDGLHHNLLFNPVGYLNCCLHLWTGSKHP